MKLKLENIILLPNRNVEQESIKELASSISKVGLLQPVLVRPLPAGLYELVCGQRRYLATKMLNYTEIDAEVMEISDEDLLAIQVTENDQRENAHPLDLAKSYQTLVNNGHTVKQISALMGRSDKYIAQILNLNNLIEPLQTMLRNHALNLTQVYAIAKYDTEAQKAVAENIKQTGRFMVHVKDIDSYLKDRFSHTLTKPPFDKKATYEGKIPCAKCQYNTANELLFEDTGRTARCLDPKCYMEKAMLYLTERRGKCKEQYPDFKIVLISDYNGPIVKDVNAVKPVMLTIYDEKNKQHGECPCTMGIVVSETYSYGGRKESYGDFIRIVLDSDLNQIRLGKKVNEDGRELDARGLVKKTPDERYGRKLELIAQPEMAELQAIVLTEVMNRVGTFTRETILMMIHSLIRNLDNKLEYFCKLVGKQISRWDKMDETIAEMTKDMDNLHLVGLLTMLALTIQMQTNPEFIATSSEFLGLLEFAERHLGLNPKQLHEEIKQKYDDQREKALEKFKKAQGREPEPVKPTYPVRIPMEMFK